MSQDKGTLQKIQEAADKRILFLPHAFNQICKLSRMISTAEVRHVIWNGEVIEDYPEDSRGHNCLLLGWGNGNRPIHVVCAPKDEFLAIITAYVPDYLQWTEDFRRRL